MQAFGVSLEDGDQGCGTPRFRSVARRIPRPAARARTSVISSVEGLVVGYLRDSGPVSFLVENYAVVMSFPASMPAQSLGMYPSIALS